MMISPDLLEKTCKEMIETILTCLAQATKGTIYQIGPMPELRVGRVTSALREEDGEGLRWGLPAVSDYNCPGKIWEQYRDIAGRPLEAMGWCVEQQKSWTADNPGEDSRSVRKQLRGEVEDSYHMEPVLVKKEDLYPGNPGNLHYPLNEEGLPIWQSSPYVVVAVIKIHFLEGTLRRKSHATRTIKRLSRTLGTQWISLQLRETLLREQKELARQRLETSKILAHEVRNTLMKFSFLSLAVNTQIAVLRQEWENLLQRAVPQMEPKSVTLQELNRLNQRAREQVRDKEADLVPTSEALSREQSEMAALPLLPQQEEQWLANKLRPKWESLLKGHPAWGSQAREVRGLLDRLESSIRTTADGDWATKINHLPRDLKKSWHKLAYAYFTPEKMELLDELLDLLDHPALEIPHKWQVKKTLKSLKAMVEVVPDLEERTNKIIMALKNGHPLHTDLPGNGTAHASHCDSRAR